MTTAALPRPALRRLVGALVEAEIRRQRGPHWRMAGAADPGIDSLERLGIEASLQETFDLPEGAFAGVPPVTTEDWVEAVAAQSPSRLFVRTSGSTGAPRPHGHDIADLLIEAAHFARQVSDCRRVIAMVPATHLYGIVWTALVPALLDVPVVEANGALPSAHTGDLIVAVPDHWDALARARRDWPAGIVGISSGGPLSDDVAHAVLSAGLARLIEIYGATETSGIAMRSAPARAFDLLPHWDISHEGGIPALLSPHGKRVEFPDRVAFSGERRFRPVGRHDGAVQVGGRNVYPDRVAALLRNLPIVADAAVRLGANGRLKAFVVIDGDADPATVEADLRRTLAARLDPAERPTSLTFGPALPRNAMGKAADWDEVPGPGERIA